MIDVRKEMKEILDNEYPDVVGSDNSRVIPYTFLGVGAVMALSAAGIVGYSALRAIKGEIDFDEFKSNLMYSGLLGALGLGSAKLGSSATNRINAMKGRVEEYNWRLRGINYGYLVKDDNGRLVRIVESDVLDSRPLNSNEYDGEGVLIEAGGRK